MAGAGTAGACGVVGGVGVVAGALTCRSGVIVPSLPISTGTVMYPTVSPGCSGVAVTPGGRLPRPPMLPSPAVLPRPPGVVGTGEPGALPVGVVGVLGDDGTAEPPIAGGVLTEVPPAPVLLTGAGVVEPAPPAP